MRQLLQDLAKGATMLVDVPAPKPSAGHLTVNSTLSLVSAGTERMLVHFGKANLLDKARQQPDKVRMVLDKIRTDGLLPTLEAVKNKLDQPLPMGYSNVGRVIEMRWHSGFCAWGSRGFQWQACGDRVCAQEPLRQNSRLCLERMRRVHRGFRYRAPGYSADCAHTR